MKPSSTSLDYEQDGSLTRVLPNGKVISAHGGIEEFTDSDGTVYRTTPDDHRRRAEEHKTVVLAFKAKVTERRIAASRRTTGTPTATSTPRESRPAPSRKRSLARSSSKSADSGDDPDQPPGHPWRPRRDPWALKWSERTPAVWRLGALRGRLLEIREGVDR
jgi:hypothetical protein